MAELTSAATTPNKALCVSSDSCNRRSEPAKRSAKTSLLNQPLSRKNLNKRNKGTNLSIFKGKEAKYNYTIFFILSQKSPLDLWNILNNIKRAPGFKRTKYAVIMLRVKDLEAQGFLRKNGTREKLQGGETDLYELTVKSLLAMTLSTKSIDDLINELDEDSSKTIIQAISKQTPQQSIS